MTTKLVQRFVVQLDLHGPAWVARLPQWDGSWYTRDIGAAKTYVLKRNAQKWIDEHDACLKGQVVEVPACG